MSTVEIHPDTDSPEWRKLLALPVYMIITADGLEELTREVNEQMNGFENTWHCVGGVFLVGSRYAQALEDRD